MNRIGIYFFLSIALFFSCSQDGWKGKISKVNGVTVVENPAEGLWDDKEGIDIHFNTVGQIGILDGDENYIFGQISALAVDNKGNVYVTEREVGEIRKFDSNGQFVIKFGRKGQGPGEFEFIMYMNTKANGDLLVYDYMRMSISQFSSSGEFIKTYSHVIKGNSIIPGGGIVEYGNNYLFLGKLGDSRRIMNIYDADWNVIGTFLNYETIDDKDYEDQTLGSSPGKMSVGRSGRLYYTKHFYDNQIFVYEDTTLIKIIRTRKRFDKPYEVVHYADPRKAMPLARSGDFDFSSYGPFGAYLAKVFQASDGVYELNDGKIVVFVNYRLGPRWQREYGMQLFNKDGKFLAYINLDKDRNTRGAVACKDAEDNFYAVDYTEYPKVLKMRLVY